VQLLFTCGYHWPKPHDLIEEEPAKMKQTIDVHFPGGKKVDATTNGVVVATDQKKENGGEASAPEPFALFLVSIATCAGIYALNFCHSREISVEGMSLTMSYEFNEEKHRIERLNIDLQRPIGFPEKYQRAIERAMDLCTVKRHIINPPEFVIMSH
jgi:ribosomal protein S12 methylthiotransferase accessory factor